MKIGIIPKSIRGRLLLAALIFTGIALLFASFSIGEVLDRFIRRGLNERLDAQIALLMRTVQPDGSIDRKMLHDIAPFTQHEYGWGWRIDAPGSVLNSRVLLSKEKLNGTSVSDRNRRAYRARLGPISETNDRFYTRVLRRETKGGPVTITVAVPRAIIDRMRSAAVTPLLISLAALGVFLLAATLLQLRIGLRPLARLKASLVEVRTGKVERIPVDQPIELRDMVDELNHLLDENAAALSRARRHVANLAHGLKTPLATLSLRLREEGRDPDGDLATLVAQIDRAIRHHLGRARAASPGAPGQPQVNLENAVGELVTVLGHVYAERGVVADVNAATDASVKCDPQDLDEMLGNLLDNAWKWATSRIEVTVVANGQMVDVVIDDDGPGLSNEAIDEALVPGRRLDERGDGHGFGLPIARELAELHGGALALGASPLGGLRTRLTLPA